MIGFLLIVGLAMETLGLVCVFGPGSDPSWGRRRSALLWGSLCTAFGAVLAAIAALLWLGPQ